MHIVHRVLHCICKHAFKYDCKEYTNLIVNILENMHVNTLVNICLTCLGSDVNLVSIDMLVNIQACKHTHINMHVHTL